MEYLPFEGLQTFIQNSIEVAYGKDCQANKEKRIVGAQCLSGTGSLSVGFDFLNKFYLGPKTVLYPSPSWPIHKYIIEKAGMKAVEYRYYDNDKKVLNFQGLMEDFEKAEDGSVILLHVCAHNPTGMDPNKSQWDDIFRVIQKKNHYPFFDMAYQGFASGDLEKDSYALRLFSNADVKLALAQSFSKNFGLYGQRVGCLSFLTHE